MTELLHTQLVQDSVSCPVCQAKPGEWCNLSWATQNTPQVASSYPPGPRIHMARMGVARKRGYELDKPIPFGNDALNLG